MVGGFAADGDVWVDEGEHVGAGGGGAGLDDDLEEGLRDGDGDFAGLAEPARRLFAREDGAGDDPDGFEFVGPGIDAALEVFPDAFVEVAVLGAGVDEGVGVPVGVGEVVVVVEVPLATCPNAGNVIRESPPLESTAIVSSERIRPSLPVHVMARSAFADRLVERPLPDERI